MIRHLHCASHFCSEAPLNSLYFINPKRFPIFFFRLREDSFSGKGFLQLSIHHLDDATVNYTFVLIPWLPAGLTVSTAPKISGRHAIARLPAGPAVALSLLLRCPLCGPHGDVVRPGLTVPVNTAGVWAAAGVHVLWIVLRIVTATTGSLVATLLAGEVRIPLGLGIILGLARLVLGVTATATLVDGHTGVLWVEGLKRKTINYLLILIRIFSNNI